MSFRIETAQFRVLFWSSAHLKFVIFSRQLAWKLHSWAIPAHKIVIQRKIVQCRAELSFSRLHFIKMRYWLTANLANIWSLKAELAAGISARDVGGAQQSRVKENVHAQDWRRVETAQKGVVGGILNASLLGTLDHNHLLTSSKYRKG